MVACRYLLSALFSRAGLLRSGLLLAYAWGGATTGWAQAKPKRPKAPTYLTRPATRPVPVPKANLGPRVLIAPSKKPLPPAQLEEALRLLLRADSTSRLAHTGTEAEGLVLDQAISKLGHDFYDLFYSLFEAPAGSADFSVVVAERPARGNTNLVVLTVNDNELLEMPLATRFEQLQETVLYAVGIAQEFLVEAQNVNRQLESGHKAPLETF